MKAAKNGLRKEEQSKAEQSKRTHLLGDRKALHSQEAGGPGLQGAGEKAGPAAARVAACMNRRTGFTH